MKRLLKKTEKEDIKNKFKDDVVFRAIDKAYKELEVEMKTFRFSTIEIWRNCFIGFDSILHPDYDFDDINQMWNDIFCELRDEAEECDRKYETEELKTATSCIVYSVVACLMASNDYKLIKHIESLHNQISENSVFNDITLPLNRVIEYDYDMISYIKSYIKNKKYLSNTFNNPLDKIKPPKQKLDQKSRDKLMSEIEKIVHFMSGVNKENVPIIYSKADFDKMIEAIKYLVTNNIVKKQDKKIRTNIPATHLRYTFYLVYKIKNNPIDRDTWIEFLTETFEQLKDSKGFINKHFSDKPNNYSSFYPNL